jgi:hypothetical protein
MYFKYEKVLSRMLDLIKQPEIGQGLTVGSLHLWRIVALVVRRRPLQAQLRLAVALVAVEIVVLVELVLGVGAVVELRVGIGIRRQRDGGVLVGQGVLLHVTLKNEYFLIRKVGKKAFFLIFSPLILLSNTQRVLRSYLV